MWMFKARSRKERRDAVLQFIARHQDQLVGVLSGFDRLVLRGTLQRLSYAEGMMQYLWAQQVLLKDFAKHVASVSQALKEASLAEAQAAGRPIRYVGSAMVSKEELAREIATTDQITNGLVCLVTSVEPCWSFAVLRDRHTQQLQLLPRRRKCLFIYHYAIHPVFGFLNARIQTWFPFQIQICLNGREWLARQLDAAGSAYVRQDNCFIWVEDWSRAQHLLDQQLRVEWPDLLDTIARSLNPLHEQLFERFPLRYYWTVFQSEWAIDLVFRHAAELSALYPRLLHHALTSFGSPDVLRFLGRRLPLSGCVPKTFSGEVLSALQARQEGVRIKHRVRSNWLKLYDKAFTPVGSVLRVETTLNTAEDFQVFRPKQGDPDGERAWRGLRRGVADLHRRAEVSAKAAERYLDALASVDLDTTLEQVLQRLGQPTSWRGRRVRALRPFAVDDSQLLRAISGGELSLNGLRNRDLQRVFFLQPASTPAEARRRSAWVSRKLRLLRAYGLIRKVPRSHRYHITSAGRTLITAVFTALHSTLRQPTPDAA
jgi:hypothetical protein